MNRSITWKGIEYDSIEHCHISQNTDGISVESSIEGNYRHSNYTIQYTISLTPEWLLMNAEIKGTVDNRAVDMLLIHDKNGHWILNQMAAVEFDGCLEIDLPLTPFTNTLPINRLGLREGEHSIIQVIYIDLLADEIKAVKQKYTRISEYQYRYENVPNDFEALITVDEDGFVISYPSLFERQQ